MQQQILEIKKQVFSRRPVLAEILKRHGQESLKHYVKNSWQIPGLKPQHLFLEVVKQELKAIYGEKLAEQTQSQLANKPLVSTIDHHGIWNHSIFTNSALIYSLHFGPQELAITFATESVSLNNTSSWSGSLLRHGANLNLERYSFFPDRQKTLPVFSVPALTANDIRRLKEKSRYELDSLVNALDIDRLLSLPNFSTQACLASHNLWQAVFPGAPRLVYLPLETLILKYLEKIFQDDRNFLSRLVLTTEGRELWKKHFFGEHTFMFWGIGKKGRREVLKDLPKQQTELINLMQSRQIYPSSPLCFAALLEAGLACAGGFTQTTWLTQTKEKLVALLVELGSVNREDADRITKLPTKNFAESSLAWLPINGQYVNPTAVDLFLSGKNYYSKYSELAEKLTLEQSLVLAMPTIYSVIVPKAQQNKLFNLSVLQNQMFEQLNLKNYL